MRKSIKVVVAVLAMSVMMAFAGCGSSKADYEKDLEALAEMNGKFDDVEDPDELKDMVDDFKARTKEAKEVKKIMEEIVEMSEDMKKMSEDEDMDYEELLEEVATMMEVMSDLSKEMEDKLEDLAEAAQDAGVSDDFLEDLDM